MNKKDLYYQALITGELKVERHIIGCIAKALIYSDNNITRAAELTGLSRGSLYRYIRENKNLSEHRKIKITKEKIDDECRKILPYIPEGS